MIPVELGWTTRNGQEIGSNIPSEKTASSSLDEAGYDLSLDPIRAATWFPNGPGGTHVNNVLCLHVT